MPSGIVTCMKPVLVCEPCTYQVCVCKPEMQTRQVQVCEYQTEQATRQVPCTVCVPQKRIVSQQVTTYKCVAEQQKQQYTVMVAYQEQQQVQVPVCHAVPTPCAAPITANAVPNGLISATGTVIANSIPVQAHWIWRSLSCGRAPTFRTGCWSVANAPSGP